MRLRCPGLSHNERAELSEFSEWVQSIGTGSVPMHCKGDESVPSWIQIPGDLLLQPKADHMSAIVDYVCDSFFLNYNNVRYFSSRAIVCPTNTVVDEINDIVFGRFPGFPMHFLIDDGAASSKSNKIA